MACNFRILNRVEGFNLIEVMISLAILSVGLLALASLQIITSQYNEASTNQSSATILGQDKIEEIRNIRYQNISVGTVVESNITLQGSSGGRYTRQTVITMSTVPGGSAFNAYKTATVTVSWVYRGQNRNIQLKTIITDKT